MCFSSQNLFSLNCNSLVTNVQRFYRYKPDCVPFSRDPAAASKNSVIPSFSRRSRISVSTLLSPLSSRRPAAFASSLLIQYHLGTALGGALRKILRRVHFVLAAPCPLCPPLPKPPSQPMRYLLPPSPTSPSQPLPPDPFLHQGDSSGGGNGTNLYACCVYLTPSPQAANSRRARKGGALSRDLAALSRTDLASQPRMDHLVLISQHHLAPISQSRSTILC